MNQYHIYEAIGRGKHSTVYKGRKKKTIEYFAIKSVDKSQKSRVMQEVRTLHSLDHSNVLKFYAWYETSAHLWLVLEYCVGGDLLTLLRQDTRLPEESIHDFARDLVNALQFLHSKGVIYCDLKPSNILLDENGRLKLCDFGLARRLSDISKNSLQQLPQARRGTPCYMAPELFQEGGVHSFTSDLWALGCVMYECYAGRPPFVSNSFTQLVNSILSDPTPCLQGNPSKELQDLVARLLIKDPSKRLQWSELCQHPFWRVKMKVLQLPPQPAFASSLRLLQQNKDGSANTASHGSPAVAKRSGNQTQPSSRTERLTRKTEMQPGHRKPLSHTDRISRKPETQPGNRKPSTQHKNNQEGSDSAVHGSPVVAPRSGNQDQPFSRTDRLSRKPETQPGQRKPFSRTDRPTRKLETQPAHRKPSVTPSKDTHCSENIPGSKGSNIRNAPPSVTPSKDTEPSENMPGSKGFNIRNAPPSRNATPLKEDAGQKIYGVNLLRLSKIVKTNLQRETEGGNFQEGTDAHATDADLMIENNDLELDFSEHMEGDSNDEEDAPDSSTCSDVSSGGTLVCPLTSETTETEIFNESIPTLVQ